MQWWENRPRSQCSNVTSRGAKVPTPQPTITMSNVRETQEFTLSSKDLPKASKDQKDITRNVENPPLSGVKFDTFIYVLGLIALLVAAYYSFQMLKLS